MDLTQFKIHVHPFEHGDEQHYAYLVSYEQQNPLYTPYLTHSIDAIQRFIEPLEFAERIQDRGAKYRITSYSIVALDEESAKIAANTLAEIVAATGDATQRLYRFALDHHFGQRSNLAADLEERYPDGYSEEERLAYYDNLQNPVIG